MPDWPAPSLFPYLFLENPWPVAVVSWAVALVCGFYALRTGQRNLRWAAPIFLVIGLGVVALAEMIESSREIIERQTQELVDAAAPPLDEATLAELLATDVSLRVQGQDVRSTEKEVLLQTRNVHKQLTFTNWKVHLLKARALERGRGQSYLLVQTDVQSTQDPSMAMMGDTPLVTSWLFTWQRTEAGQWELADIEWLELNRQSPTADLLP